MAAACVAVIPARYGSVRFPGKALAMLAGKPLVLHVVDRARAAGVFDRVCVATDDERIATAVRRAGGEAVTTRAEHESGTARVAEVAAPLADDAVVFNVQGDEPLMPPALLAELVQFMLHRPAVQLVTAAHPSLDGAVWASPNAVKVVVDAAGRALYFSRAAIPFLRRETTVPDGMSADPVRRKPLHQEDGFLRHVGVYGFRAAALRKFVMLPPSGLERREGLEQLRALEHGMPIHVVVTLHESIGVDTPEDLAAVAARLAPPGSRAALGVGANLGLRCNV